MLNLTCVAIVSMAFVSSSRAHEIQPLIVDLEAHDGVIDLRMRVNLEAILAGIDLSAILDTDEADEANTYDRLRGLDVSDLAVLAQDNWNILAQKITIDNDETPLRIALFDVAVQPETNRELSRTTDISFRAILPTDTTAVSVSFDKTLGSVVVRQNGVEDPYTAFLEPGENTGLISLAGGFTLTTWQSFVSYLPVGFDHILPLGLDHILFVLGLFLYSTLWSALLWQVTAFTAAHTLSLALASLGFVTVSPAIVEPLIAASIVYVAVENLLRSPESPLSPKRPLVVFGLGLLHGLGFATMLGEFGLPSGAFIPSLLGFNVGLELGQLTVLAMAGAAVFVFGKIAPGPLAYRRFVVVPGSLFIAAIGLWWVVERVFL